ncbi:helix-turn-helix domain-containing protein [Methylocystis iwaonis]|uniref:helix-turn-helix domain-containing protein n=2 Tax=Methylocystaceae TaxID=31993 RepID=UPI0039B6AFBF
MAQSAGAFSRPCLTNDSRQSCTHWRMQIAARRLVETRITVDRLAEHCGYESAASFSRAFKRTFGVSPATFRKNQAQRAD